MVALGARRTPSITRREKGISRPHYTVWGCAKKGTMRELKKKKKEARWRSGGSINYLGKNKSTRETCLYSVQKKKIGARNLRERSAFAARSYAE